MKYLHSLRQTASLGRVARWSCPSSDCVATNGPSCVATQLKARGRPFMVSYGWGGMTIVIIIRRPMMTGSAASAQPGPDNDK
jgi:hypothetical protein